jgi:hypothetical protein
MAGGEVRARNAKLEQFIAGAILREIKKSGVAAKLYQN